MEKRTDHKGRLLHNGESQRKDGRYAYKYIENGVPKFIYSWKLVSSDRVPKGKRDCVSLREKIKQIQKDLDDCIDTIGKKMTLCDLYKKQNKSRANVRQSTVQGRKTLMEILKQDQLGHRRIDSIKPSDAKEWAIRMKETGYAYQTINNYKRSLKASFYIAIQDDYVRKNPFDFKLSDVIKNDTKPKGALTEKQVEELLKFVRIDNTYKQYYQVFIVLLNTGLRISELCGLTLSDIDFNNRTIDINHQLKKDKKGYYTEPPKSDSGYRKVPMTDIVYEALKDVLNNRENEQSIIVDGYSHFIFLNKNGYPMYNAYYTSTFYNGIVI